MILATRLPDLVPRDFAEAVRRHIEGVARAAAPFFSSGALPPLRSSGIRYALHPQHGSGIVWIEHPATTYRLGRGDCGALAAYRMAELLARGERNVGASVADWLGNGDTHAQVRRGRKIEDPSIECGAEADWPVSFLFDLGDVKP